MPSITDNETKRPAASRRTKIAMIVAAVIIVLPGLVTAVLYSRHRGPAIPAEKQRGTAPPDARVDDIEQKLLATGDLNQAAEAYGQLVASGSQDYRVNDNLGVVYARLGQYDQAIASAREAIELAPDSASPYANLAIDLMARQDPEGAHDTVRRAMRNGMDSLRFHSALYALAFLSSAGPDKPAMVDQLQWFARRPKYESDGLMLASNTEAFGGHVAKARDLAARAVDTASQGDRADLPAVWTQSAALREAAFGNAGEARKQAETGLKLAHAGPEAEAQAALTFALIGDPARAEALAQDVNQRFPADTQLQSVWLPAVRAELALLKKNPDQAINNLAPAVALELGESTFGPNPSCLYSTYLRGQAYLADEKGTAAATEFQKIIDHDGVVWNCWTGALAHLGLARAYTLQAQEAEGQDVDEIRLKALMAYKDFLRLWKDADPAIPVLMQAKDELANMQ
jgi:eukaryotic-like serine/threonine-protein kinase